MSGDLKSVICVLDRNNYGKDRMDFVEQRYNSLVERHPILTKIPLVDNCFACYSNLREKRNIKDNVSYLPYNVAEVELANYGAKTKDVSIFQEGQLLVRNPFDPHLYLDAIKAEQEVIQTKIVLLSEIFKNLGAKSITADCHVIKSQIRKVTGKGKMRLKNVKLDADLKSKMESKYNLYTELDATYPGEFDLSSYKRAKELCDRWFASDEKTKSLVRQRNPEDSNLPTSFTHQYSLTSEINNTLDIAFNAISVIGKGNFNYTSELEEKNEIETNFKVLF